MLGKMVPSWGRDGGETRRTLGGGRDKRAEVCDYQRAKNKNIKQHVQARSHAHPGLDLTVSGRPLFVGVVVMVYGRGDLGFPGVVTVGVVGAGDMGLQVTSGTPSHPGALLAPSLLPDF